MFVIIPRATTKKLFRGIFKYIIDKILKKIVNPKEDSKGEIENRTKQKANKMIDLNPNIITLVV